MDPSKSAGELVEVEEGGAGSEVEGQNEDKQGSSSEEISIASVIANFMRSLQVRLEDEASSGEGRPSKSEGKVQGDTQSKDAPNILKEKDVGEAAVGCSVQEVAKIWSEVTGEEATSSAWDSCGYGFVGLNSTQMEIILPKILKHCGPKDVASCRLVNSLWLDCSFSFWRKSVPLCFSNDRKDKLDAFVEWAEKAETDYQQQPFRQLSFTSFEFGSPRSSIMDRFWKLVGGHLTNLSLKRCFFDKVDEFRQIVYRDCLNLESLTLISYWREVDYREDISLESVVELYGEQTKLRRIAVGESLWKSIPVLWLEFLSHFPHHIS